nr:hypothetical protein BaRGS_002057 [Batillaria attramentaria]KAG5697750.1 hypothetical protein BaRGS_006272 [Batillaria attramentaria]
MWREKRQREGIDDRECFAARLAEAHRVWSNASFRSGLSDSRKEEEKDAVKICTPPVSSAGHKVFFNILITVIFNVIIAIMTAELFMHRFSSLMTNSRTTYSFHPVLLLSCCIDVSIQIFFIIIIIAIARKQRQA